MTSTVFINERLVWSPKHWVLEVIFREIIREATVQNYKSLVHKLDYMVQGGIGNFKDLDEHAFNHLIHISEIVFHRLKTIGLDELRLVDNDEELFGVLWVFHQFQTLLQIDNRSSEKQRSGLIVIDSLQGWRNKQWVCFAIVRGIEIYTRFLDWSQKLAITRHNNLTVYKLSSSSLTEYRTILEAIEYMQSYFNGTPYVSTLHEIVSVLPISIESFAKFVKSDNAIKNR